MPDGATLKIDRAVQHVKDLEDYLCSNRPFNLVIETDTWTGNRTFRPKKEELIAQKAATIAADAVHNLRSSLDHAYWEIVSPFASANEERSIQFPFCKSADKLEETLKNRLAHKVSSSFVQTLLDLKPHKDKGGNEHLCMIDDLDIIDRHRLFVPTVDKAKFSLGRLYDEVPDFPEHFHPDSTAEWSNVRFSWKVNDKSRDFGTLVPPTLYKFERKLSFAVDIEFDVVSGQRDLQVLPTLHQLVNVAREALDRIRAA
jgi:hypothetical protein